MFRFLYLLIGYGFGCLQSAYFAGKIFAKIDIREHGSGNAGMTNVYRVMGAKAGIAVFIFDILKSVVAYTLASLIFNGSGSFISGESYLPGFYAALGAILGHNFPFFLKFKGGKGAACTVGLIFIFDYRIALICTALSYIAFHFTRYVSLSSLIMTILFPIFTAVFGYPAEVVFLAIVVFGLCYYKHLPNIERLIGKTENKFVFKKRT